MNKNWNFMLLLLGLLIFTNEVIAQVQDYELSPWEDRLAFQIGGGIIFPFTDVNFEGNGVLAGELAQVFDEDVENDFGFAVNIGLQYGLPRPLHYFSVGISLDYQFVPLNDFMIDAATLDGNPVIRATDDIANIHVGSILPFLRGGIPIKVGSNSHIIPYAQIGLGVNINITDDDAIEHEKIATVLLSAGGGVEWTLSNTLSLFVDARYHFNKGDFELDPAPNSNFDGEITLSNLSVTIGINIYLTEYLAEL